MGYLILLLSLVFLDQITKYLIQSNFKLYDTFPLIQDVFHLTYVQNKGAAFSILKDKQWFLILVTIIALIFLAFYFKKVYVFPKFLWLKISLIFIASGAIGNLIDRIRLFYVIDFFDFRLISFAIFNVADICVVTGGFLLAYMVLFVYKEEEINKVF